MRRRQLVSGLVAIAIALVGAALLGGIYAVGLSAPMPADAGPAQGIIRTQATPETVRMDRRIWVEPDLLRRLERSTTDELVPIIAVLRMSDPDPIARLQSDAATDRVRERAHYVHLKQSRLAQARAALSPLLARATATGQLTNVRDLWLADALALRASPALVRDLVASPRVAEVHLDRYRSYLDASSPVVTDAATIERSASEIPWGLTSIRAPEVWHTLGLSGTGAVVAVMDTGVDWQHPELAAGYRGNVSDGIVLHSVAWYDAVNGGLYPYDDYGHGTHVAGTAVGWTTGVAPGASWLGVKVLNTDGYGFDSWILGGFQWLLAPGGDPALAPDIVNGSWSSSASGSTIFLDAINALKSAGILPVFAAGNAGPERGSIGSPASNPGVFAVGASDPDRETAVFSGRGPSYWREVKPFVVAPGVNVVSAGPGGTYAQGSGTSMAAPHVAGLGALMRGISPTLPVEAMARLITETAHPLTLPVPNNTSGWGQIDAFDALVLLTNPAVISGTVCDDVGRPISGAVVTAWLDSAVPGPSPSTSVATDDRGSYHLALRSGRYTVRATAFGHHTTTQAPVNALAGSVTHLNLELVAMPTGTVAGRVTVVGGVTVPTTPVRVRALGTPVHAAIDDGGYRIELPVGTYTLEIRGLGYRVATGTVEAVAGPIRLLDFALQPAPRLLLVDEGAWYYGSEIAIWREALDARRYAYDQLTIKHPDQDTPVSATLLAFDIVLWSSPTGSPGLVGAGRVLSDYLGHGGRLLLSGQDVAYLDGGGLAFWGTLEPYLLDQMGVRFLAEQDELSPLDGDGPFRGMGVTLGGGTGADNQSLPDAVTIRDPGHASEVWRYGDASIAGVATHICVPHRSLFFGFGLEGITKSADRQSVLQRSIDWLMQAPLTTGLALRPVTRTPLIARPGGVVTHVVEVLHIGAKGVTESVTVESIGGTWATQVTPARLDLAPCSRAPVTVTVAIDPGAGINESDALLLTASSASAATPITVSLTSKTPAPVLLVDDDRWYPMEQRYVDALNLAGVAYDIWDTLSGQGGAAEVQSPDVQALLQYPIVVWFTGYDWYAPIEGVETERLLTYLDEGGRLLLSSQDFAYHHAGETLMTRLGATLADWTHEPLKARGVGSHPAGGNWGPVALDYPFPNWSHTLEPAPGVASVVRGQVGQPLGIGMAAPDDEGGATLYYAFPLETLPLETRRRALSNGLGWLSPLGGSTWRISPTVSMPGEVTTFEVTVRSRASKVTSATFRHQVPEAFVLDPASIPPGIDYDPASRELSWTGLTESDGAVTHSWQAIWDGNPLPTGGPTLTLSLPAWNLTFQRSAPFLGRGPELRTSRWLTPTSSTARVGQPISLTYALHNRGGVDAEEVELSLWMMTGLGPVAASTELTGGMTLALWQGTVGPQDTVTATAQLRGMAWATPLRVDALLSDASGYRWEDVLWLTLDPWSSYLPIVVRTP